MLSSAAWIAEAPSFTLTHAHLTSGLSIVYLSGLARSAAHETLQNLRERLGSGTQTQQQQPWYVYTHREKKEKETKQEMPDEKHTVEEPEAVPSSGNSGVVRVSH